MRYAKGFFDLQYEFAQAVSVRSGLPLARTLLDYTNLYIRFGLGREFDPDHPGWREYLAGLRDRADGRDWTYLFYSRRPDAMAAPAVVATVGCFAYARLGPDRIRLHFQNVETDGHSPLAIDRRTQRAAELAALFAHVRGEPPRVVGASWLYNLEAYRRLFPPSYLATARVLSNRFRYMPLWGQFVDRRGEVKERMAHQLLERIGCRPSLDGLDQCFPFQVISAETSVRDFYEFYGV